MVICRKASTNSVGPYGYYVVRRPPKLHGPIRVLRRKESTNFVGPPYDITYTPLYIAAFSETHPVNAAFPCFKLLKKNAN